MLGIERRSLSNHTGERIRDWIDRQPADTIFALSLAVFFLLLLVVISIVWEIVRKCRSSWRGHHHRPGSSEHWRRLEDGSSVLLAHDGRPISRLGPMASLMRHGPVTSSGGARHLPDAARSGAYQPARTGGGETHEMRADALTMSGRYAPYDPPATMHGFEISAQGATGHRNSMATTRSGWSGETRVTSQQPGGIGKREEQKQELFESVDEPKTLIPDPPTSSATSASMARPEISPSPASSSATNPFSDPLPKTPPPESSPVTSRTGSPSLPATPAPSFATQSSTAPSVGESAFSTPKSLPITVSASPSKPVGAGHGRNGSFSARPLTLGASLPSASGGGLTGSSGASSSSNTAMGSSPPKVELRRTWSIGTWIPQLRSGDAAGDPEQASEERAGLVRAATSR